jgi:hypothetical protein
MAQNPIQWTVDQVWSMLREAQARATTERAAIVANRQHVNALWSGFVNVIGPPLPGAEANLRALNARQQHIEATFQALGSKIAEFSKRVQDFLAQHGVNPSEHGLAGLGQLPPIIVGAAIIGVALLVLKGLDWLHTANSAQNHALSVTDQALNLRASNRISEAEFQQVVATAQHEADQGMPPDPFGLTGLAKALVPLALVLGGGLLVWKVLPALLAKRRTSRRLRRSYA